MSTDGNSQQTQQPTKPLRAFADNVGGDGGKHHAMDSTTGDNISTGRAFNTTSSSTKSATNNAALGSKLATPNKVTSPTNPQQQFLVKQDTVESQYRTQETRSVNRMATTYEHNLSPPRQQPQSPRMVNGNGTPTRIPQNESKLTPLHQQQLLQQQHHQNALLRQQQQQNIDRNNNNNTRKTFGLLNYNNQQDMHGENTDEIYETIRNNNLSQQDFIDEDLVRTNLF
jgi:hypothetical protein